MSQPTNLEQIAPYRFKPGQSGNPGGKPQGARNKLQGSFLRALADDFEEHGAAAIRDCRETKPDKYLAVIASLMPKVIEDAKPLDDLTDEQLESVLAAVRAIHAASGAGSGNGAAQVAQPAAGLPALPEAS